MLSDATIKRLKEWEVKIKEFMDFYNCDRAEALQKAYADNNLKTLEAVQKVASAIDDNKKKQEQATLRAMSAQLSTYKANIAEDDK